MKLGFVISETTVSRHMPRLPAEPDQVKRWAAFLRNHKNEIAAMDLFTVPTASFRLLYGFFVIEHGRRHIVHFNATFHPTSLWVMQQLREAFPYDTAPRYLIFDGDAIFSPAVVEFIRAMGTKPIRTSYRSPWQNGTAERWIGSCRRELLEHVVVLGERHLVRLVRAYITYYHEDRCHLGLGKDTPDERSIAPRPSPTARVVALPRAEGGRTAPSIRMARGCVGHFRVAKRARPELLGLRFRAPESAGRMSGAPVAPGLVAIATSHRPWCAADQ